MEQAGVEEIFTERSAREMKETQWIGATNELLDLLSENKREVMTMVQGYSNNIQRLNDNVTMLKEDIMKIEEKFDNIQIHEDLRSLKLDLEKTLKAQKDISKSKCNIEKDYSAIKAKLSKVYGNEFFKP